MIRTFSKVVFAAIAAVGLSASAQACPINGHPIKLLTLKSDGTVTRSVYVKKDVDGQRGKPAQTKYVPVVRDQIKLEHGDQIKLNASPTMVDASLIAQISLKDQDRDEKGIFSSTYHVVELSTGGFGGPTKTIKKAYLLQVKSNYVGNGTYNRGCGDVVKTDLDLESSEDTRH